MGRPRVLLPPSTKYPRAAAGLLLNRDLTSHSTDINCEIPPKYCIKGSKNNIIPVELEYWTKSATVAILETLLQVNDFISKIGMREAVLSRCAKRPGWNSLSTSLTHSKNKSAEEQSFHYSIWDRTMCKRPLHWEWVPVRIHWPSGVRCRKEIGCLMGCERIRMWGRREVVRYLNVYIFYDKDGKK